MTTLVRWLARRPLWLLHVLGTGIGWFSWFFSPTYRHRCAVNAQRAGVAPAQWRASIAQAGRMIAEMPWLWLRPADEPLGARATWQGGGLIDAAHAAGKGIVFLTPHLGCFEVTAQAIAERFAPTYGPITVLYRPARQPWLRELVEANRARPGLATAPATLAGVRLMIRALRRGEAVGLLPDQVPPSGMGVWAPFFGQPAYTMTLAARLLQQTGAVPLLIWGERLPRGAGYVVHVHPFPEALPAGTDEAAQAECAAIVNRAMEGLIRARPEQYLWGYDRYKTPRDAAPSEQQNG